MVNSIYKEEDIYENAKELFNKLWDSNPVRLIGLSASDLSEYNNYQLSLFEENEEVKKQQEVDDLISSINKKIGKNVIYKGNKK